MSDESDLRGDGPGRRTHDFLETQLCNAMAKAMKEVLTDPEVIESMGAVMINVIQKQAAKKTGNFVLGALKTIVTRWFLILILLVALAQVVGLPQAVKALAPVLTKGAP